MIKILLLNMQKLFNIPSFSKIFVQKFQVFIKISQVPGFSRFFSLNCQIPGFFDNPVP